MFLNAIPKCTREKIISPQMNIFLSPTWSASITKGNPDSA